ncbi:MAG: hypothetical protein HY664_03860 [Chloroflexi bacterium]|nr:hypothetical protein [Chloroflexota bacterium]
MTLTEARDWAVLALAALGVIQAVVVIFVGLTILRQAKKASTILDSAARSAANFQKASWLLSRVTTWPVVRAASLGVGLWQGLRVLARGSEKRQGGRA